MAIPLTSPPLTTLLNSLHTHLQTQTQLLPALHAQLGLPPSALEDDLEALQRQLVQSLESHIDTRKREVEKWVERCEAVELECLKYSKALGGNVKATGSSAMELSKEAVLPRRFDLVSEHQEKLRQMYHTKSEQLTTLTNRLKALSHTLGSDYFSSDVLEPAFVICDSPQGSNTNIDVTPERFLKLEKELVRGKAEVQKRLQQLSAVFVQIDWLYTELGVSPPVVNDLLSTSKSNFLGVSASSSQYPGSSSAGSICDPFAVSTPTPSSRNKPLTPLIDQEDSPLSEADCQRIFTHFVARVEEAEDEGLRENTSIPLGLENVNHTQGLLSWAANLHASLEAIKRKREAHIQAMYDQLEALWKRLGVDEVDMDAFVEAHRGSTEDAVREYEEELERMLELKRERMGIFIESARAEITKLWDDLMVGEDERADFAPFVDDEHTEELLTIHEDEIRRLKEERRQKAPLLASIKRYFDICEEEKELAAAASDQTRLLGRGRDPGRLLREEKMRKRVSKEKPRLEQDLLVSIPAWEQEARRPFLVHGESFLQFLMATVSAVDQENKRKPRAGSVPPRATTPVSSSQGYVPGSKTGTSAARTGSGSQSVPNKRQKLGDTDSTAHSRQVNGSRGHTPNYGVGRPPLGLHHNGNVGPYARATSPSKIPGRTPSGTQTSRPAPVVMPIPKSGTQHHALGHGRVPTGMSISVRGPSNGIGMTSGTYGARYPSAGNDYGLPAVTKKATRARRESFKPRPSMDGDVGIGVGVGSYGGRWPGVTDSVKEEDED